MKTIEGIYREASGSWFDANWEHGFIPMCESVGHYEHDKCPVCPSPFDEDGNLIPHPEGEECQYCTDVELSAEYAEDFASEAMAAIREGDFSKARDWVQKLRGEESQWGDTPTWGEFILAVEKIAEEEDEQLLGRFDEISSVINDDEVY